MPVYCDKCGEEVPANSLYCPFCGQKRAAGAESPELQKAPEEGRLIANRYRVETEISRGVTGALYQAFDTRLEQLVAIKMIPGDLTRNPLAVKALKKGVQTTINLTHPNIVKLHNYEEYGEKVFLVMEWLEGVNLATRIAERGKLPVEEALNIALQILEALAYTHSQNIIHRDLQPGNILLSREGKVKIADPGIDQVLKDISIRYSRAVPEISGTLPYLAPEQIRGKSTDARTDIYAFGVTLYEILSGHPPFETGAVEYQILNETPEPIHDIPQWLNSIILKCLEKDPAARFPSAAEIKEALNVGVGFIRPEIRPAKPKVGVRFIRPGRKPLIAAAVILICLLGIAGYLYFGIKEKEEIKKEVNLADKVWAGKEGMVYIPEGEFTMGGNSRDAEKPVHKVYLSAFYIDKYEVTADEYTACVNAGVCNKQPGTGENCNYGEAERGNHPINCVTWYDAYAYCRWEGKRLPTEAEWEKAARGTDGWEYPWGDEEATCSYAVMNDGGKGCGTNRTWPVGSKPEGASPYGVMDMAGNVWEWGMDWYDENYYKNSPDRNPEGPDSGKYRVFRGGSWNYPHYRQRAADRSGYLPGKNFDFVGFRCAR